MRTGLKIVALAAALAGAGYAQEGGVVGHPLPQGPHVEWYPTGDAILQLDGSYVVAAGGYMPFEIGTDVFPGSAYLAVAPVLMDAPSAFDPAYASVVFAASCEPDGSMAGALRIPPSLAGFVFVGRTYLRDADGAWFVSDDVIVQIAP
jgi:hypothetical protein